MAERLRERLNAAGLSQSALARRAGVSQQAISRLVKGERYGSRYLHRIAHELGTTSAYLMGETDDPLAGAPPLPEIGFEQRELLSALDHLNRSERSAISTIVTALGRQSTRLVDLLPSEPVLTAMFEALLSGIDPRLPREEQALLLAQRLPIGLEQVEDVLPDHLQPAPDHPTPTAGRKTPARHDHEPQH